MAKSSHEKESVAKIAAAFDNAADAVKTALAHLNDLNDVHWNPEAWVDDTWNARDLLIMAQQALNGEYHGNPQWASNEEAEDALFGPVPQEGWEADEGHPANRKAETAH